MFERITVVLLLVFSVPFVVLGQESAPGEGSSPPIRALLICGGCCHDYAAQHKILYEGIQARANVQVDVWWTNDASTNPPLKIYDNVNWANNYDVIIHDECAAANTDVEVVKRILEVHKKTPAVHLHCAMHSFRNGTDLWFKHIGMQSTGHGPHAPIDVTFVDKEHPIVRGMADWTIEKDELYNNAKLLDARALATGTQIVHRDGVASTQQATVIWTNETQGARSFSMSIGHYNEGVSDDRYLSLVARGVLWACGKLAPEYQKPFVGENSITFVESKHESTKQPDRQPKAMPENATLIHVSASSIQSPNFPQHVLDGSFDSRWCARDSNYPQSLQLEFEKPQLVTNIKITWERNVAYQYRVLASPDGKQFITVIDASENEVDEPGFEKLTDPPELIKSIRVDGLGTGKGGWCSIREIEFQGKGIMELWPANSEFRPLYQPTPAGRRPGSQSTDDPNAKQGNIEPKIEKLTPQQEAEILQDVQVPEGFETTVFAAPPAVNYPVFVAAAPDGTLFVSSDGNGSLGRNPGRGRIIRLRDTDGDGRADQTNVFCKVDAPRGLVWDHDRLYLMHPPHLSVFIDSDSDGVADEQRILVKDLAFGYDKRPADHTTNGLSLGVDGYLYVAGGDFGFIDAEGTDGRKLTHRGGGVIRVRTDGTGLELYSTGTRNILEVAISPQMELFARDNTNDGGGWDVRFHHFTGGDNHGYPRLYKNFPGEYVSPLADYGGGSGCGAVYIDEPGFGPWNNAPFTADWGTGALYHHNVQSKGASYVETKLPQPFVRMTRPTDADVDGMSQLYCASWRGATFKWEGPNVGYIVQVRPKDFLSTPLPEFGKLADPALVGLFDSPSYRRRLAAQRELVRRGSPDQVKLYLRGIKGRTELRNLVYRIQNDAAVSEIIAALDCPDAVVQHVATGELAKRLAFTECLLALDREHSNQVNLLRALAMIHRKEVIDGLLDRLSETSNPEFQEMILSTLCRLHFQEAPWDGQSWGTRPDTRGPYYQPVVWNETPRIATFLHSYLESADPDAAIFLVNEMSRNRIQSKQAMERVVELAVEDSSLINIAVSQLANADQVPGLAIPLLVSVATSPDSNEQLLTDAIRSLAKTSISESIPAMFAALQNLNDLNPNGKAIGQVQGICLRSRVMEKHIATVVSESEKTGDGFIWADCALLQVASRKDASSQAKATAVAAIKHAWNDHEHRLRLIQAALETRSHFIDDLILASTSDLDSRVANAAANAAIQLKLNTDQIDTTPKLDSLDLNNAIELATGIRGDVAHGEVLFTRANCIACHTISKDEIQKGPYLGNISRTYQRKELATAILQPSRTIAQGFGTNIILDASGRLVTGYVTEESADRVVMRDSDGKEFVFERIEIESRKESLVSAMPEGLIKDYTVRDLASLLDYLEAVSAKNGPAKPQ